MFRRPNTLSSGSDFSQVVIHAVWIKGKTVPGFHPDVMRKDCCDAFIRKSAYGTLTNQGWEIDHITPVAAGGIDYLFNLQPLQWQNNRHKADNLNWNCAVSAR